MMIKGDLHYSVKRKNRGDSSIVDENIDLSTKEGFRPGVKTMFQSTYMMIKRPDSVKRFQCVSQSALFVISLAF